jgi:Predicted nucleic acid-binding protein, contains PIN domain
LSRHRNVGLDTSIFIYQVEENEKYFHLTDVIFDWLEQPRAQAVTSTITLLELLVQPYRLDDIDRVNKFYALLSTFPHLEWVPPTLQIADVGARYRAEYNLRTPDAIQAATAFSCGATGFVSNDIGFQRVAGLDVLVLDNLLESEPSKRR